MTTADDTPRSLEAARRGLVVMRAALIVGLVASAALFVDYRSPVAAYCGGGGGCEKVRNSALSHIAGVPTPTIGILAFLLLVGLTLWAQTRAQWKIVAGYAGAVALGAVGYLAYMGLVVKAVCPWCIAVDSSAILAAGVAWWLQSAELPDGFNAGRPLWGGLALVAVAAPVLWGQNPPVKAEIPAGVKAMMQPGKVNIIQFTDFECPYCRKLHPTIEGMKENLGDRARHVRLMRPLSFHKGAEPAALAYLCAPDSKKDALAHELYELPPSELNAKGVVDRAKKIGLDPAVIAKCMADVPTRARLKEEIALFKASKLRGLPATFVGEELVSGANVPQMQAAVDRALEGKKTELGAGYMFAMIGVLFVIAAGMTLSAPGAERGRHEEASDDDAADDAGEDQDDDADDDSPAADEEDDTD